MGMEYKENFCPRAEELLLTISLQALQATQEQFYQTGENQTNLVVWKA